MHIVLTIQRVCVVCVRHRGRGRRTNEHIIHMVVVASVCSQNRIKSQHTHIHIQLNFPIFFRIVIF